MPSSDYTAEAWAWADSVAAMMSDEELAGQLFMPSSYSDAGEASLARLRRYCRELKVGGIVLLKGDANSARTISDSLARWSAVSPFVAIDAENGLAMRLSGTAEYPWFGQLHGYDEESMYDYGERLGREARGLGINMILGPVADVTPPGGGGYIGIRSLGDDARRVAALATAYARGVESSGVMSVAKHFPGHGGASDSHKGVSTIQTDRKELEGRDLLPFREYISQGLSGIMAGHLEAPAFGGGSASASPCIIDSLLRQKLNFNGLVITDAMNMAGAGGKRGMDAVRAGADMVLSPADTRLEIGIMTEAMRNGTLNRLKVREHVRRILFYKYRFCGKAGTP